jgi:3-hydroxypropanoate dehydrogenase
MDSLVHIDPDTQDLLFRTARTANTFSSDPVTEEQVRALYDLIRWAPTSMNTQPLRMVLAQSPEARARLLPHMSEGNRAKTASAPLVAILAADINFHEHLPRLVPYNPNAKDNFIDEEKREKFARNQAWLQAGYFILGVRALGLAAGPMSGFNAAGVDADLLAGTTLRSFVVVNIGKPGEDAWMDRLPRLDYEEVVTSI